MPATLISNEHTFFKIHFTTSTFSMQNHDHFKPYESRFEISNRHAPQKTPNKYHPTRVSNNKNLCSPYFPFFRICRVHALHLANFHKYFNPRKRKSQILIMCKIMNLIWCSTPCQSSSQEEFHAVVKCCIRCSKTIVGLDYCKPGTLCVALDSTWPNCENLQLSEYLIYLVLAMYIFCSEDYISSNPNSVTPFPTNLHGYEKAHQLYPHNYLSNTLSKPSPTSPLSWFFSHTLWKLPFQREAKWS